MKTRREHISDLAGPVFRPIIDYDNFKVLKRLSFERLKTFPQILLGIIGGDNNGKLHVYSDSKHRCQAAQWVNRTICTSLISFIMLINSKPVQSTHSNHMLTKWSPPKSQRNKRPSSRRPKVPADGSSPAVPIYGEQQRSNRYATSGVVEQGSQWQSVRIEMRQYISRPHNAMI